MFWRLIVRWVAAVSPAIKTRASYAPIAIKPRASYAAMGVIRRRRRAICGRKPVSGSRR